MFATFLKYLAYEKRYSKHTITSYENDLRQYFLFLQTHFPELSPKTADYRTVRSWIVSLTDEGLSSATINRKIASLRSYYKFLLRREEIQEDPTRKVRALKAGKRLPHFVRENEMLQLLDQCPFAEDFSGRRDQLTLELLYGTGIRLSELISLKESDVDFHQRHLKVLGKRNKERIIPFSMGLERTMQDYLKIRNTEFGVLGHDFLIVTDKGQECYPMFIYRTVRKYLSYFTTLEKQSPHILRHTFATHLLNKGAELNAVKDLLGHSSLAATQVYTHNSMEKLKAVFEKAHPKA